MKNINQIEPKLYYDDCPGFDESKYKAFREQIIKSFEESYLSCVDLMDEDDEIRIEAKEQYGKVQTGSIMDHADMITHHLTLMWEAVCGNPDYYYGADSEETQLLKNLMIHEESKQGGNMADQRIDIILEEVDQEFSIPSYMESYVKRGIARALKRIDQQRELLSDLKLELTETM